MLHLLAIHLGSRAFAAEVPTVGDVYVNTEPVGAAIMVDGTPTGQITPSLVRGLTPGHHVVRVEGRCARGEGNIEVQSGQIARAELALVPGVATLDVAVSPVGAVLLVDGVERGPGPLRLEVPACAEHVVVARAAGHTEARQTLVPPPFVVTTLSLVLVPERFGVLVLDLTPIEAQAVLDGNRLPAGPQTLDHLAAGPHALVVEAKSHLPYRATVEVKANEVQRLAVTLQSNAPARRRTVRLVANSAATAVALGIGGLAAIWEMEASQSFDAYLAEEDDAEAEGMFAERVEPAQARALIAAGAALAVACGSTFLWVTTDFNGSPSPTPVIGVGRTW